MADINKIWMYLCVFVVVLKTYSSTVVQDGLVTWSVASGRCGSSGLEFRESIFLKESGVLTNKTFWLGKAIYRKTSHWMEILGCYDSSVTPSKTPKLSGISSIAECQIQCSSRSYSHFGYKNTTHMCYCTRDIPQVKIDMRKCRSNDSPSACFFYQVYQRRVSSSAEGHCTTLYCSNGYNNLKAESCFLSSDFNLVGRCGNDALSQNPLYGQTYDTSLLNCISKNQLLLSPLNYCTNERKNQGIRSWTNVFREVYNCHLTKAEAGNKTPFHCLSGHLVKHDGQWKLNKTERNCNEQLEWFLCRSFEPPSTIASSSVNVQSKSTKTFQSSSVATLSPVFPAKTEVAITKTALLSEAQTTVTDLKTLPSKVRQTAKYAVRSSQTNGRTKYAMNSTQSSEGNKHVGQNDHHINISEDGSSSKLIGAVIGGLLGACSVIALLVVLIVCKFRSIGVFKESSTNDQEEPSQMEFSKATYQDSNIAKDNKSTKPTSNETYGLVENSTAVYAVVNKIKTPQNNNETFTDAGYGEYDHLHDIQNRRIIHQENMYHSHNAPQNEEDQTYDSSNFSKGKCNDGNSLYDQSCSLVEGEYSYSTNKNLDNSNTMGIYDKIS